MKHYLLTAEQSAANGGKTDLFVIEAGVDLTESTDNTDQVLTLDALAFGDVVQNNVLVEINLALGTTAAGTGTPSADTAVAVSLGVTGAATQFLGASAVFAAGAATAAKTAYASANSVADYPTPTGGKDIILTADVTDVDGSLAELNYGEIWVWLTIVRWARRHIISV